MKMLLTENQIRELSQETRIELLDALLGIEDELGYECKRVSNTIDYIQERYI